MNASIDTYAQWEYLNIMLEVVQETVVFPLYWWFGKINKKDKSQLKKVKDVYLLVFIVYALLIFIFSFFVADIVKVINPEKDVQEKAFFVLQLWSKVPNILLGISIIVLLNMKAYKKLGFLVVGKVFLLVIFDLLFANANVFTNNYIGLGTSSLVGAILLLIISMLFVADEFGFREFWISNRMIFSFKNSSFNRTFFSNLLASFLFSCTSNIFYLIMMAKNMNLANGSAAYWLSNQVIWSWILLLPNVLGYINKSIISTIQQKNQKQEIIIIIQFQVLSFLAIAISMLIFIPLYKPFTYFLSNSNLSLSNQSWAIFSKVICFYIFYALSQSISAYFNAKGANWILFIQTILTNIIAYLPFIALNFINKIDLHDVNVLAIMFGITLFVSFIVNLFLLIIYLAINRNKNLCITD